jgi:hypothetical protein
LVIFSKEAQKLDISLKLDDFISHYEQEDPEHINEQGSLEVFEEERGKDAVTIL